jgi:hypothetical protein
VSLVEDRFCNNISAFKEDEEEEEEEGSLSNIDDDDDTDDVEEDVGNDGETIQICTELCHNPF